MIRVLKSGLWSSIQDGGRLRYRSIGVPVSGFMDSHSAKLANALVGNSLNTAVIEFTAMGPELYFEQEATIAITGATFGIYVNDEEKPNNTQLSISRGDTLRFKRPTQGWRGYIAVSGGFEVQEVLGSKSMYQSITVKGKIDKNYLLQIRNASKTLHDKKHTLNPLDFSSNTIEVYKGPEYNLFNGEIKNKLTKNTFTIHQNSNRMATQISGLGEVIFKAILTVPVQPGTVQITPSGALLVLMQDAQTTGGYPRIFQLTKKSLSCLAQKRPNEQILFKIID